MHASSRATLNVGADTAAFVPDQMWEPALLAMGPEDLSQTANRAANALACAATSVTAVLSHHIPRNGGPIANN
ncbi:Uncharacterised protein [Pseudomonas fluorescens]|uniref:Uncharacterized protein n=1 Tax=Pseudomonas fluorescens TaxID=294 RepID=A0A3S4P7I9_PSEFL|nr:Uncharacterised protein [Pseudomonas fluorescens]